MLSRYLPPARRPPGWTGLEPLPGGDFPTDGFETLVSKTAARDTRSCRARQLRRLVRAYGTRVEALLGGASRSRISDRRFGADLTEAEVLLSRQERMGDDRR